MNDAPELPMLLAQRDQLAKTGQMGTPQGQALQARIMVLLDKKSATASKMTYLKYAVVGALTGFVLGGIKEAAIGAFGLPIAVGAFAYTALRNMQ